MRQCQAIEQPRTEIPGCFKASWVMTIRCTSWTAEIVDNRGNSTENQYQEAPTRDSRDMQMLRGCATDATDNTIRKGVHLSRRNVTSVVRSAIFGKYAD